MKTTTLVKRMKARQGFTLIELIVVIVVIAILSSLVIVSYKGAGARTSNAATLENIKQYINAIQLYKINTGAYPKAPAEGTQTIAMVCLGTGYQNGTCGKITGTQIYESATFMSNLRNNSGSSIKDVVNNVKGDVVSESFVGAVYGIDSTTWGTTGYARMIEWFLYGTNQDCGIAGSWNYNTSGGNTACEFDFEEYNN